MTSSLYEVNTCVIKKMRDGKLESYMLKITTGYAGEVREVRRLSLKTKSKREADRLMKEITKHLKATGAASPIIRKSNIKDCTPDELLTVWRPWAEQNITPRTLKLQEQHFVRFFQVLNMDLRKHRKTLGSVKQEDVQEFALWAVKDGGYTNHTANGYVRDVRALYNHAIKRFKLIEGDNPAEEIQAYKTNETQPPFLTVEQADRLVEAAQEYDRSRPDEPKMEFYFLLGLHAGLRKAEIVNAKFEWFDWKNKRIIVPSSHEFSTKSMRTRSIDMDNQILESIKPHSRGKSGYLFDSGKKYEEDRYGPYRYVADKPFKDVCKLAGLETINHLGKRVNVTPQILRYTFGSIRYQAGVRIEVLSHWLGHADIGTTRKHYINIGTEYNEDVNLR